MKIIAFIQARVASTRLPGKALLDLAGKPMLERVLARAYQAKQLTDWVVATTEDPVDDAVQEFCSARRVKCYRGNTEDVLDRYYRAAIAFDADVVVRITSDCPLIDPMLIDKVVHEFVTEYPGIDYACNVEPHRTFPRGLDVEVLSMDVLERVWLDDKNPRWREHVTAYIRRNAEMFRIRCVTNDVDLSHYRWCVDTKDDLTALARIYQHFGHDRFSWREVLALVDSDPQWYGLNGRVEQKVF